MQKTTRTDLENKKLVTIQELQEFFSLGKQKLNGIAQEANAILRIGRRKLYNVEKIQAYIEANYTEN